GCLKTPIIVRASIHIDSTPHVDVSASNDAAYHGGWLIDELAALASLCLGSRIMARGESRLFERGGDPFGKPVVWHSQPGPPICVQPGSGILPSATGSRSLGINDPLAPMASVFLLASSQYASLIRACNLYRDALWMAESEPNLAWIMLVSAIEVAAEEHGSAT